METESAIFEEMMKKMAAAYRTSLLKEKEELRVAVDRDKEIDAELLNLDKILESNSHKPKNERANADKGKPLQSGQEIKDAILKALNARLDLPPMKPSEISTIQGHKDSTDGRVRGYINELFELKQPKLFRKAINGNTYAYHVPEAFQRQGITPTEIPKKKG